ncbi:ANTAR domain-containing protein [Kribbella sp. NPDC026611]|uniref:ANTAR domain-containing protein n=1 Tax=Kribbella sp. NPDC026611 TaxID=3154911 RepID=UPI0033E5A8A8
MSRAAILARLIEVSTALPALHRLGRLGTACRELLAADGASITVDASPANRVTIAATDPMAARLEDLENVLGEGPCHLAYEAAEPVAVQLDSELDMRWPEFARCALEAVGPVTIRCFPIHPAGRPFGVLSSYVSDGRALAEGVPGAQFLADALGVTLLRDLPAVDRPNMHDAWSPQGVVDLATGMVADQLEVTTDDALALLRARAYASDKPLTTVADYVVARRLHFDS